LPADDAGAPDVVSMRPFVPAKDFERSLSFYTDLGFTAHKLDAGLAGISLGPFGFLLQSFYVEEYAGNFMMQLLVNDVDAWWKRIEAVDLVTRYGVRAPTAPAVQPWGLKVSFVVDPSGVLWHIAERKQT
jgi:catechol 2,3-dioxygenase-like lactoylglutathione lyase family enzyme